MVRTDCCYIILHTERINRNSSSSISPTTSGGGSDDGNAVHYCATFIVLELYVRGAIWSCANRIMEVVVLRPEPPRGLTSISGWSRYACHKFAPEGSISRLWSNGIDELYITFLPLSFLPPSRSQALCVGPQKKLVCSVSGPFQCVE